MKAAANNRAKSNGHYSLVDLLLKNGANVDLVNNQGYTALMIAANESNINFIRQLLDSGKISVNDAKNALDVALKKSNELKVDDVRNEFYLLAEKNANNDTIELINSYL